MSNNRPFCARCTDLDTKANLSETLKNREIRVESSNVVFNFGAVGIFKATRGCPCCESIDAALLLFPRQMTGDIIIHITCPSKCTLTDFHNWNERCEACLTMKFEIYNKSEKSGASRDLIPTESNTSVAEKLWRGAWARRHHPHYIDMNLIRYWLQECDETHYIPCSVDQNVGTTNFAMYLLDTEQDCLVSTLLHERSYVALSYVWGPVPTLKTTLKRLEEFKQPGSLRSRLWEIPRTIRDAMALVKNLGMKYLWVDCLCIIQDDKETLEQNLKNMGAIYANAYLTVVAAKGVDAGRGLRGVGRQSKPRRSPCPVIHLPSIHLQIAPENSNTHKIKHSPWGQRCWTFQEAFLARRALIFDQEMTWYCPTVTFKESMTEPDRNSACFDPELEQEVKMGLILQYEIPRSLPYLCVRVRERIWILEEDKYDHNWKEYRPIIKEYNRRNLTSDEDITRAFAGIIEVIGGHTRQSFHFGLPAAIFNIAMLWQPSSPSPRRRLTRTDSDRGHTIPSWSWMGWQCDLNLDSWRNKPDYQFTTALVEWHSEPQCPWRQQIFHENPTSVEPDSSLCLCRQIATARQFVSNAHTIERSSLLYCKSERAWLYADDVAKEASKFSEPVYLYNRRNARVGHMVLLCKPRGQGNSTPSSGYLPRREMELILISKGFVSRDVTYKYDYRSDLDRDICEHLESAGRDYQFYNVLGVEWLNGIAYRVGLGRVEAKALAEEPREVLDVVLG